MKKKAGIGLTIFVCVAAVLAGAGYGSLTYRVSGETFDSNGVPIHYTVQGHGTPVVLLHGFAVNADLNWRWPGIIEGLAQDYRVIAMDLRGHGLSGKPHDPEAYGMALVHDVVRLLDHLDIEKAHVAGYSLGGFITLKLAATAPGRLLSAAPLGAGWERSDQSGFLNKAGELADRLEAGHGITPPSAEFGQDRPDLTFIHKTAIKLLTGYFNDRLALAALLKSAAELELSGTELKGITVPVLSIAGAEDPLKVGVDNMKGRVPQHTVVVIEGTGHMRAPRHPKLLAALERFLAKHSTPPADGVASIEG